MDISPLKTLNDTEIVLQENEKNNRIKWTDTVKVNIQSSNSNKSVKSRNR